MYLGAICFRKAYTSSLAPLFSLYSIKCLYLVNLSITTKVRVKKNILGGPPPSLLVSTQTLPEIVTASLELNSGGNFEIVHRRIEPFSVNIRSAQTISRFRKEKWDQFPSGWMLGRAAMFGVLML